MAPIGVRWCVLKCIDPLHLIEIHLHTSVYLVPDHYFIAVTLVFR